MRKSGSHCMTLYTPTADDTTTIIRLPIATTLDEPLRKIEGLGQDHLGVVTTANGFAIRVKTDDQL